MIKRRKIVTASKRQEEYESQQSVNADSFLEQESGFFTRDDETEYIEEPLETVIRHEESFGFQPDDTINLRCYIDYDPKVGNTLDVDVSLDDFFFNIKLDKPIDMRKIKSPKDLKKYVPELLKKFKTEYLRCIGDDEDIEGCDDITAATEPNPDDWQFNAVPLKSLKKGAWFTIKPIAYPTDKQVYIKDDYDREEKKFMCGRCDDISYSTYFKGDKMVYDDNNFEY